MPGSKGQVILVPLPGHAVGHIGAFILTDNGWVLLASDAAWSPLSYQQLRGPSRIANLLMADSRAYYQTLQRLNHLWRTGKQTFGYAMRGFMIPFMTLWHYFRIRRLHFANRKTLEAYQVKNFSNFLNRY